MIVRPLKNARVVYQKGSEHGVPEPAITVSVDASGLVILEQAKDTILLEPEMAKELFKAIKQSMEQDK